MMRALVCAAAFGVICAGPAQSANGRLVIAGGAVAANNAAVHGAFIAELGDAGRVAVIPAASGEPARSAKSYVDALIGLGVPESRIDIVRLAVKDDAATPQIDESAWAGNAAAGEEIAKVERASAIWFTGGDQARIIAVLLQADGRDTPMLAAIRARLAAGATIGGTSAGAAVMSQVMIARGDSLSALTQPLLSSDPAESTMDGGPLMLSRGLALFADGLVDQHFDRKARLGRLTRALAEGAPDRRIGFGVDEDTALVVDIAARTAVAAGAGGVTVLDARDAKVSWRHGRFLISDVHLSLLAPGDRIDLGTLTVSPAGNRVRIEPGGGYYTHQAQSGAGMALPNPGLEDALGVELLDNRASARLERVSFDQTGAGVRYVFSETPDSWGAFGGDRYTINRVRFSIEPVRVRVQGMGE